ncbi:MAG TPA: copper chaperone PCu(A)C [Rhizomicrobium sp.]|nr:copper chaperone PCu(A)C [Rhizomicrobium sp.]
MRVIIAAVAALLLSAAACAAPSVTIANAWIRALPGKLPSAGYFTLHNGSGKEIVLTGASAAACGSLMLHRSQTSGGMARMSDMSDVTIAPGRSISFAPGGYHLMCENPSAQLKPGAHVPVTLIFADGTRLTASFAVRGADGR